MRRLEPGPGQESVWDYPRPPRLEPVAERLQVLFNGVLVADTTQGFRVLETSHPPTYYIPPADVQTKLLKPAPGRSLCEFKGEAAYWTLTVSGRVSERAAWSYPAPWRPFEVLKKHYCFYASRVDECRVAGESVQSQAGDFYGGWITGRIVGPFKGAPGTMGW
ncbi:DUF427 domain-containing protein [Algihabitans albus]|uniref:DUF427 domain-containing protein n=1 Tax=Algihabitans albus TaxID=2164067 RepID=UPI000E5D5BBA|nr:DUF427 domain-containing protein [Algihabitans albus]